MLPGRPVISESMIDSNIQYLHQYFVLIPEIRQMFIPYGHQGEAGPVSTTFPPFTNHCPLPSPGINTSQALIITYHIMNLCLHYTHSQSINKHPKPWSYHIYQAYWLLYFQPLQCNALPTSQYEHIWAFWYGLAIQNANDTRIQQPFLQIEVNCPFYRTQVSLGSDLWVRM